MNDTIKSTLIAAVSIGLIGLVLFFGNRNDNDTEPDPSSQQQTQEIDNSEATPPT